MSSLLLPTVYLGGCIAAMSAFSYVYRRATSKYPHLRIILLNFSCTHDVLHHHHYRFANIRSLVPHQRAKRRIHCFIKLRACST